MRWITANQGFSEVFTSDGAPRPHYGPLVGSIESFTRAEIERRERLQKLSLVSQGITFTVYGEKEGLERIFPFDFVPRIIPAAEWKSIQDGLVQRITALNLFLLDIYQEQKCLTDGVIPAELDPVAQGVQARAARHRPAAEDLHPRGRHRHHPERAGRVSRARGQLPRARAACRTCSRTAAAQPRLPRVLRLLPGAPDQGLPDAAARDPALRGAAAEPEPGGGRPDARASTTRPTSSTRSWRARWACLLVEGRDLLVEGNHVFMRTHARHARRWT